MLKVKVKSEAVREPGKSKVKVSHSALLHVLIAPIFGRLVGMAGAA